MAGRRLAAVVGVAAGLGSGALVVALLLSHPVALAVLFVVFLASVFTLLGATVVVSDGWLQRSGVARGTRRRSSWRAAAKAACRRAIAGLRHAGTRERRRAALVSLRRFGRVALDELGFPLEEAEAAPVTRADALEQAVANSCTVPHLPRDLPRGTDDEHVESLTPAHYRVARDALERASTGAKDRSAALVARCTRSKEGDTEVLRRAFAPKRGRAARRIIRNAGHTALVTAASRLPDRSGSAPTR